MVQTRGQTVRNRAVKSGGQQPSLTRYGPSCLKPLSASRKRSRKRQKIELKSWPFEDLFTSPPKPTATAIKADTMAKGKTQETPTGAASMPSAATKTGTLATSNIQKTTTPTSTLPKDLIEQYTLSITPHAGADLEELEELEEAIRNIESPCGNIVWSSSCIKERTRGSPTTLDINVIYNDCSCHRKITPYSCRKNLPAHSEALKMEDVVRHVRDMDDLVAACEVLAWRSWAVNAVSHGGNWQAS